jgi:hypothetical protein
VHLSSSEGSSETGSTIYHDFITFTRQHELPRAGETRKKKNCGRKEGKIKPGTNKQTGEYIEHDEKKIFKIFTLIVADAFPTDVDLVSISSFIIT